MKTKKPVATLLQIAHLGHEVLRRRTHEAQWDSLDTQLLIKDMIATCKEVRGVGIAAPQVYQSLRLFIVASTPNIRYPRAPKMKPLPVLNPKMITTSREKTKDWEGCLSIPGIRGLVPRHNSITLQYQNKSGSVVKKTYSGFVARIFQHEFDHIEGLVFLDRVLNNKELITEKEYLKMIQSKYEKPMK